jgi:drug/metabolite transporter (DMT)-like permease
MLVLCCALWALSFPTTKALTLTQQTQLQDGTSWFFASLCVVYRFGIAAAGLFTLSFGSLRQISRSELSQGLGLGLFGGLGILLQVDGLAHTSASTSAFLTQCYCVWIPLWVGCRERRWPPPRLWLACALVMAGVAILARVDWRSFHLGRGEWETILASVLFAGQILWLERPCFARNRVMHFSAIMFAVMAFVCLPVAVLTTRAAGDWLRAWQTVPTLGLLGILVLFCTFGAYLLMNRWQRHVTASEAGLIYCLEPVFASACALFLPGWFSAWAGIEYANERLTAGLLIGGGLITMANVLVQLPSRPAPRANVLTDLRAEGPS